MTPRERLLTAIRHKESDTVPVSPRVGGLLDAYYGCRCWMHQLELAKKLDFDPIIRLGPGVPNYAGNIRTLSWVSRGWMFISPQMPSWTIPNQENVSVRMEVQRFPDHVIIDRRFETPAGILTDKFKQLTGQKFELSPDPIRLENLVKGPEDLDKIRYLIPDLSQLKLPDFTAVKNAVGDNGLVEGNIWGASDKAGWIRNISDLMVDYYRNRDFLEEFLKTLHNFTMAETRAMLEAGLEGIWANYFWMTPNVGWSPKIWRELILPLVKDHVNLVHSYDAIYHHYDDGPIMHCAESLADAGVDVLTTISPPPLGDANLVALKEKVGDKICLHGYIDNVRVVKAGTPETVMEAVRKAIQTAAPGGGFILGNIEHFDDKLPPENLKAYFEAARVNGKYPIK